MDDKTQKAPPVTVPAAQDRPELLRLLPELGEMLLCAGGGISRTEDTLTRIGQAYGTARMDVYVSIYSILLTMEYPDGMTLTGSRRLPAGGSIDFRQLEKLNALSRHACVSPMDAASLRNLLYGIRSQKRRSLPLYIGSMIAAGSFAVFFGGSPADGIAAALCALFVALLQTHLGGFCPNPAVYNFICSLMSGLLIGVLCRLPFLHPDKVMIGDIMLLNPGIAMMSAFRDMLVGNTLSGALRLLESLLWAASLASGFMVAMWALSM